MRSGTNSGAPARNRLVIPLAVLVLSLASAWGITSASAAGNCGHGPGSKCSNHGSHVTVKPYKGLTNGQLVTISGTGFIPNGAVSAEMCAAVVHGNNDCDLNTAQTDPVKANSKGAFTGFKFTVSQTITTPNQGTINCTSAGNCSVGVISNADFTSKNPHSANEDVGFK